MFYRVTIRHNETGEVLADVLAESTAHALADYVRANGYEPDATADSVLAAAGLDVCDCGDDHATTTIGFRRSNPITGAAEVDVFAAMPAPTIPSQEG